MVLHNNRVSSLNEIREKKMDNGVLQTRANLHTMTLYIYYNLDILGRRSFVSSRRRTSIGAYQVHYRPTIVFRCRYCCPNGPTVTGTLVVVVNFAGLQIDFPPKHPNPHLYSAKRFTLDSVTRIEDICF